MGAFVSLYERERAVGALAAGQRHGQAHLGSVSGAAGKTESSPHPLDALAHVSQAIADMAVSAVAIDAVALAGGNIEAASIVMDLDGELVLLARDGHADG